jgi:hypothetical protein
MKRQIPKPPPPSLLGFLSFFLQRVRKRGKGRGRRWKGMERGNRAGKMGVGHLGW